MCIGRNITNLNDGGIDVNEDRRAKEFIKTL
jgi:hypothetical protein